MNGKRDPILLLAMLLTMIGAFNWLLVTLFRWNVVEYVFGPMATSAVTKAAYIIFGLAAIYMIIPFYHLLSRHAERPVKQ